MPVLRVKQHGEERGHRFSVGASVCELLLASRIWLPSNCGGVGRCGLCRVSIESGEPPAPTPSERRRLSAEQLESGLRLACQVRPEADLGLTIPSPAPQVGWRPLTAEDGLNPLRVSATRRRAPESRYGVAVDLGTSQVRLTLCDLVRQKRLAGRTGPNRQSTFGADILTRLMLASRSADHAQRLRDLVLEDLRLALRSMCAQVGLPGSESIGQVVLVGNRAMAALVAGEGYEELLEPEVWSGELSGDRVEQPWSVELGQPDPALEVVRPVAGFVGSDLLASVLATKLTRTSGAREEQSGPALLLDFGTNSELALWDGETLWVTSAAGGPAFEGCGTLVGMPAGRGAIQRVYVERPSRAARYGASSKRASVATREREAAPLRCEVIDDGEPWGLCGSGLVDLVAHLLQLGVVDRVGKWSRQYSPPTSSPDPAQAPRPPQLEVVNGSLTPWPEWPQITLRMRDIDALQRAKAAVIAAAGTLLKVAGVRGEELQRLCVCGAFGRALDVGSAQQIGVLPAVSPELVERCAYAALEGCERMLIGASEEDELRGKVRFLNMCAVPEYENRFIEALQLAPASL